LLERLLENSFEPTYALDEVDKHEAPKHVRVLNIKTQSMTIFI
jgi:hypothetical protein